MPKVKIIANNPDGLAVILTGVKIDGKVQMFTSMREAHRLVVSRGWMPVGMVLKDEEDGAEEEVTPPAKSRRERAEELWASYYGT